MELIIFLGSFDHRNWPLFPNYQIKHYLRTMWLGRVGKILNLGENYNLKNFISFYVMILVHLTILAIQMTSRVSEMDNNRVCTQWGHIYWKKHYVHISSAKVQQRPYGPPLSIPVHCKRCCVKQLMLLVLRVGLPYFWLFGYFYTKVILRRPLWATF